MPLEDISFSDLAITHLQRLIEDGVKEGYSIEYKQALPGNSDDDKKEFLADITSLANARGGYLIYGISEERDSQGHTTGIPETIIGCSIPNSDAELRRIENIARDGIEPRIIGTRLKAIPMPDGKYVLVYYIPKSLHGPHVVTFKGVLRFYSRNAAGKYPLSVSEIRTAFLHAHQRIDQIRQFRINRIAQIVAGETPSVTGDGAKVILHLIPLDPEPEAEINPTRVYELRSDMPPLDCGGGFSSKFNFDGLVTHNTSANTYALCFRNGTIETVSGYMLSQREEKIIPSLSFEYEIRAAIRKLLLFQEKLSVSSPIAILLTLTGVRGYRMALPPGHLKKPDPIDRDSLVIPEIISEGYTPADQILKPMFDAIWNASDWPHSPYFNEAGEWIGDKPRR